MNIIVYPKQIDRVVQTIVSNGHKEISANELKKSIIKIIGDAWGEDGHQPLAVGTGYFICYGRKMEDCVEVSVYFTVPTDENTETRLNFG